MADTPSQQQPDREVAQASAASSESRAEPASAASELEELLRYMTSQLVDNPDAIQVRVLEGERTVMVELSVAKEDLGKVIGRDGRTARALRAVLAASSARFGKRAVLEILE